MPVKTINQSQITEETVHKFMPVVGRKASLKIEETYYDGIVTAFLRGKQIAKFKADDDEVEYMTPVELLEKPLASDVNERFDYFRDLTKLVMHGKLKSLFVSGEGGIGKSFTLAELLSLENFVEDGEIDPVTGVQHLNFDYVRVKGYTTAKALFNLLQENHSKLIIFEDCDSALTDTTAQNILKAVLDTYERRRVSWNTNDGKVSFDFKGSVIFLSNKNKEDVNQAIISRSVIIDLFMSREEIIERMEFLLPGLDCAASLTIEEKFDVLRVIDKYKHTVQDLNLRTLIKALIVYENGKDINLTRYQIVNG